MLKQVAKGRRQHHQQQHDEAGGGDHRPFAGKHPAQRRGGVTAAGQFEQPGQPEHPQKPQIDQMVQKDFQEEGQDSQKVNHGGG